MNRNTDPGLDAEEAAARLARHGPNRLFTPAPVSFWRIAAEEVMEPMILLLLAVGFFYSLWGGLGDALTIFAIILTLVAVEVGNEFRTKRAIAALDRTAAPRARVRRDGEVISVDTEEIVPGDMLVLLPGTRVAADARLTQSMSLALDESALTGESFPQEKAEGEAVFAGTVVTAGEAEAGVTATGADTRLGRMAAELARVKPPKTPLQLAMKALAGKLVWVALFFSIAIPLIGWLRGGDFREMVLTGLSLAFATIPEELPIIITMVLGLGSYALSRKNFLVKRLRAAETLGDATVIVTDKTGTLTESRLQVAAVHPPECEASIIGDALGALSAHVLDPLEQAIVERSRALGMTLPAGEIARLRQPGNGRRTKAVIRRVDGELRLHVSGAPEEVFALCETVSPEIAEMLAAETALGRRVIATATRVLDTREPDRTFEELERGLELAGLVSFADPPRPGVKETLARIAAAGIRTVMVTGDHPATAAAIAREVGIPAERVLTGTELDRLSDTALTQAVREVSVYARATPQHKHRLVQALQRNGEVVAVTGDGVNDALALKSADVGIAMGIKGTDVAKEAAQAVFADDNYVTIARGVFEGRKFFDNLRKGVAYYLSVKVGLIAIFLLPVLLGLPLPFSPIQIILLELFMDLAASAGFVTEPAEEDIYRRRPRHAKDALLGASTVRAILLKGALLFAAVMAAYALAQSQGLAPGAVQTFAFAAWMAGHVVLAFVSRCDEEWILRHGVFTNRVMNLWALAALVFLLAAVYLPFLRETLRFEAVPLAQFGLAAGLGAFIAALAEFAKLFAPKYP